MLQCLLLTGSALQTDSGVSFTDLELLCTANLVLIGLHKLRLSLLMPPVLLLEVANLIVMLLKVVLEGNDLVFGGKHRILETSYVFIPLMHNFLLVPDAVLCRLYFSFDALY